MVLVGKGDWHAIPEAVIVHEKQQDFDRCGAICVALRKDAIIDVFRSPMSQFVKPIEKRRLNLSSHGYYNFNYDIKGNRMIVNEDNSIVMDKIITIPYGEEERKRNIEYNQKQAELNRRLKKCPWTKLRKCCVNSSNLKHLFTATPPGHCRTTRPRRGCGLAGMKRDKLP